MTETPGSPQVDRNSPWFQHLVPLEPLCLHLLSFWQGLGKVVCMA